MVKVHSTLEVVLAIAASPSPLDSDFWADVRVDSREARSSSSFMESYLEAETIARVVGTH
jgi:hypothetical protein